LVGAFYGNGEILKAAFVASADVLFGNIVTSSQNAIADSGQVDLNACCPDVDQHGLKAACSCIQHHLQVALSRKRGLNGKAFGAANVFPRGLQYLARGCNRK
jgi:hypothetical protein